MTIQTATNPQTGERVALINGQWVPVGQTATNDQGQKAYLVNNQWLTDQPAAPVKDAGFSFGDIAKSFGIGATGSTKALTDVAGAGNVVSSKLEGATEGLQKSFTPERQAEMARQAARMKAAEESGSTLQEIKAGALNVAEAPLQSAAQAIGSFVPYLPALLAAPIAVAMRLTPAAVGVVRAVAQQAPKVIGTAQGAGAVKGSIYDGVLRAEMESGTDPEAAKQKASAAQDYFGKNFDQIALGGGLGYVAGSKGVEELFSKAGRAGAAPGMARRVGEAVVKESIPEAAQGGQERLAQNIALQREGYDVDTFKGVAGAATQEALTGALGAAPIAALSRPEPKTAKPEQDAFEKEEAEFRKQFGATQPVAPEPEPELPTEFPGGYTATRRELSRQDVPEGFGIFAEGSPTPLSKVANQEEANAKLQTLSEIRQQEQARLAAESEKLIADVNAEQRKLDVMEATGQTGTDEYIQAKAAYEQKAADATQKIDDITQRIADYSAPLNIAPVGTRVDVQSAFDVKRGEESIGTFNTLEEAQAALQQREPEAFKQAEEQARVQTDDRIQQLEKTLTPLLAKFNLQDVGLKVVDKIKNNAGGSYLDRLIQVAIDEDKPIQTMRHESMHALKDLDFFTPQQWKALTERANKQWIKQYLADVPTELDGKRMSRLDAYKQLGLSQEEIVEEAISDAFGAYDRGETPPPGMIAALYKKLKNFFLNFGQALRGAGFESADDVFQRVERGELKSRKPKAAAPAKQEAKPQEEKLSLPPARSPEEAAASEPSAPRTYKLDIEREKRKMARSAFLTDEEQAAVNADAQKLNLTEKQLNQIIKTIKADKKRYPATQGWADLTVIGIDSKTDDDGNVVPDSESPKYATISYAYNVPPGSTKAPQKVDPAWLKQVTGKFQSLVENIYKRAAAGDVNAQNIIAHQTWYKNVAATLRQEYGGFGDTLADLLGATSPNTPVDTNWRFSIDVMRRFVRGDFDAEMQKFVKYLDTGKSVSKYPSSDKIRQISGKLYGMNSTNAMLALADTWRAIKPGQAPKARNFALNLIGQSNMATIDVWAARMLRRAANMVPGASFDRIPPPAEQGVSGTWNADATKVTGAFGFGAEVMQKVSDNLAKKGIDVAPPDLQAIAWFAEKELWGKKGWTTKTGEGGSFEENIEAQPTERYIAGHSVQIGSDKPEQKTVLDAQKRIQNVLKADDGVLAYRVMQTSGLYGNEVEASFDTEIVADKGKFDPEELIKELASISKKNQQWDIFVSRVIGVNEESANARPGVEIYFRTPQDMAKIMPTLERFTSRGQDGFTLAVDPRAEDGTNQYIGVRLQYVPEISMRWDEDLRQELLAPGGLERVLKEKAELLEDITADVAMMDGVAHAAVANYDTVVIGKENYNDYIEGRVAEEDQAAGSQPWFGEPVRSHVKRAVARLQRYQGQDGEGSVSDVGEKPSAGEKLSLRTSFSTAKEAEDAAYDKAPPSTKEFKQFFGASTVMDEGRPQPMYHGSASGFTTFSENKPIFISPDPQFAEQFAEDRAKDEGKSSDEMRIYPLWVRAETPFDYENKEHAEMVAQKIITDQKLAGPDSVVRLKKSNPKASTFKKELNGGLWSTIEDPVVQDALKSLGFDSFYVAEQGNKNLAVFKAEQVKSITGNIGDFSRESKDMRFSLKKVRYSDERFEKLWNESMYTQSYAEKKTKGYLAFVNPMEFVRATVTTEYFERLLQEQEPLDVARLKAYDQVPFLSVSEKNGDWKITGHEGRHRMLALHADGYREVPVYIHLRAEDAESIPVKALTAQYTDAVSSVLLVAEVEPLSYANKQKAMEKFTRMSSKVKYSLPTIPAQAENRIGETTTTRERKNWIQNLMEAITPQSAAHFRTQYLNRYNQLSVYDKALVKKMGGVKLLAEQSAEMGALMSDLGSGVAASAMGVGDRNGGIPVFRNGITTIDRKTKGLIASLAPLAAYNDPAVCQRYQYWAMVKRGVRLNKEGKDTGIDTADVAFAKMLEQKHPEFVSVQKDLIAFNNGLVQYMVDTGVLSKERGHIYTKHADYIPFYRQMDGDTTVGPNLFQSLSGVKPPKALKGKKADEAPIADFLETMVRNTQSAIQAGIKNAAAQRAIGVATQVKEPGMGAERLNYASTAPNVINVLEKGKLVSYVTPDNLLIHAMMSLNQTELPFMNIIAAPANLLRTLVTKEPGFMMANLVRDSLSAWVTSGVSMTPVAGTVINFGKALVSKSPGFEALMDAGILGGYEFSANIEQSGQKLQDDLDRKAGKKDPLLLRPFTSVWDALEKGTTASDAATRVLVYERVLAETGSEAEALGRALEVMNFHRKGSSPLIRVLTAAVPFFNARLQGLDLFYRASTGNMNNKDSAAIQRQFFMRGMTMMALSVAYWFAVSDDEEYKKQEQETKDNNWLLTGIGVKIPIPFEVGILFKVIPERIAAYTFGNDTGQDLKDSMFRSAVSTFAFNPTPQAIKPLVEATYNFNPFTWRAIVSEGMEDVAPKFQVGPGTSNIAIGIGQALNISPLKVDHVIKGYAGTLGMYAIDALDAVMDQFGDSPKPSKRFEQLPVFKRFVVDPEARGNVTQYYQLKDAVDTVVRTMNLLEKTGESEEYLQYLQDNIGNIAIKDYVSDTEKVMKTLREARIAIRSSSMTADEKRDALTEINQAESAVTSQIQDVKKMVAANQ